MTRCQCTTKDGTQCARDAATNKPDKRFCWQHQKCSPKPTPKDTSYWLAQVEAGNKNLAGANLSNIDLSDADLSGANLEDAKLNGSDLSWTTFVDANLEGASLAKSNLERTNFIGANIERANFFGAKFYETVMPSGKVVTQN
jgi:uncharacterized protein YjbI with pentapeptide repeats